MNEVRTSSRKTRVGKVVSDKMDKTVVVAVADRVAHPLYKNFINLMQSSRRRACRQNPFRLRRRSTRPRR